MSRLLRTVFLAGLACAAAAALGAQEVQQHGLFFERWARDTFFGGYKPGSYTQKWDIPADANKEHGNIPVNPKAVKHGAAIDLGDAIRQYEINEPFLLLVGFWEQEGDQKRFTNLVAVRVTPEQWQALWAPITYADLLKLDTLIKDPARPIEEIRRLALRLKNAAPFSQAVIQMNPKIDARQSRLQCSIRFADFYKHLAPDQDPQPQAAPTLWGAPAPGPIQSPARK